MAIPYRTRRFFKRFFTGILVLILFATLGLLCWLLWLDRYVVYSQDGAKLDFSQSVQYAPGVAPVEPEPLPTVTVHNKVEEDTSEEISTELVRFSGYYVTLEALTDDFDGVAAQLEALEDGTTVLLELKDPRSYVYYTSGIAEENPKSDTARVDELIKTLQSRNFYVIAQITSFQEYYYILEDEWTRVPYGLPKAGGNGSLWLDSDGPCYWMNPTSDGTLTYLIQLVTELRSLGFDEVLLADFRFPDTDKISFEGDRLTALNEAAATLVKTCATDTFCVSFARTSPDLTLPAGRTRLYLTGVRGADIGATVEVANLEDLVTQLVFLTESGDTRYDDYCVLRPLDSAH